MANEGEASRFRLLFKLKSSGCSVSGDDDDDDDPRRAFGLSRLVVDLGRRERPEVSDEGRGEVDARDKSELDASNVGVLTGNEDEMPVSGRHFLDVM
jgi:hypothetical protein